MDILPVCCVCESPNVEHLTTETCYCNLCKRDRMVRLVRLSEVIGSAKKIDMCPKCIRPLKPYLNALHCTTCDHMEKE